LPQSEKDWYEPLSEQLLPIIEGQIADLGRFLGETAVFILKAPSAE
jgi:hypothetical protein